MLWELSFMMQEVNYRIADGNRKMSILLIKVKLYLSLRLQELPSSSLKLPYSKYDTTFTTHRLRTKK